MQCTLLQSDSLTRSHRELTQCNKQVTAYLLTDGIHRMVWRDSPVLLNADQNSKIKVKSLK